MKHLFPCIAVWWYIASCFLNSNSFPLKNRLDIASQRYYLSSLSSTVGDHFQPHIECNSALSPSDTTISRLSTNAENCFIVGVEDKTQYDPFDSSKFSMKESMAELMDLAAAAGLKVVGSTYQRLNDGPLPQYYIGSGKSKEISRIMDDLKCQCVIFDTELTPSQQKNLEKILNVQPNSRKTRRSMIKVIDRTALILDIFAQHAKTREGQLQVELALLTYRLPRLTKMWSHLERQTASSKGGRTSGGVGLRGPGEQQLEADRRHMKAKIAQLNKEIDLVRLHRSLHRKRRKELGVPVVALVGYTNSGKSTLLNAFTRSEVLVADMLFATLDPTTRLVRMKDSKASNLLMTDTVGFIQKLPTNLIAAFRATLEEIMEADIVVHVTDISTETWKKQEAAVLAELANMGLMDKPLITVWNKVDLLNDSISTVQSYAKQRANTVVVSALSGFGLTDLMASIEDILRKDMKEIRCCIPYEMASHRHIIHRLGIVRKEQFSEDSLIIEAKVPQFLFAQLSSASSAVPNSLFVVQENDLSSVLESSIITTENEIDWKGLGRGRHSSKAVYEGES